MKANIAANDAYRAQVYLEAAERLLIGGDHPHLVELHFFDPACFLIYQAVELALIAYLRIENRGAGVAGHRLDALLQSAIDAGLDAPADFVAVVTVGAPAFKNHQFRYTSKERDAVVAPGKAIAVCKPVLAHIMAHAVTVLQQRADSS